MHVSGQIIGTDYRGVSWFRTPNGYELPLPKTTKRRTSITTYVPRHTRRTSVFKFFNEAYVKGVASGFTCSVLGIVVWSFIKDMI